MHKQTAKFVGVVAQNLPEMPDDLMQSWIENPKGLQKVLKNALCPPETMPSFKIFQTITLGTGITTADDFRKAIKDNGMEIGKYANDILGKSQFTVTVKETELDLVNISVADLGFKNGETREKIYARAKELGLELCPNEVGPQLRLQYKDQPKGEVLIIAMEPITDSDGDLELFHVDHNDNSLWLNSYYAHSGSVWNGNYPFVFVLPRK
ncbi:hypothetical protein KJ786_00515 [Patescibacteria group bacterium]|nr:hypothetical protein [Patescibacteria group bacterium]